MGAHYARYGNTALNWYNAPDPRPDYYRYLPSYFEDEDMQMQYRDLWRSGRPDFTQINWDNLYLANANTCVPVTVLPYIWWKSVAVTCWRPRSTPH